MRIGLPWLLADGATIHLYLRVKNASGDYLARTEIDPEGAQLGSLEIVAQFPRTPINVAVSKRGGMYWVFFGATIGGGLYVAPSSDGRQFDFSAATMLVSSGSEWGWDFYKVCGSPDNTAADEVDLRYTAGTRLSVGAARFSIEELLRRVPAHSILRPQHGTSRGCDPGKPAE